jgi:hypothetical protein
MDITNETRNVKTHNRKTQKTNKLILRIVEFTISVSSADMFHIYSFLSADKVLHIRRLGVTEFVLGLYGDNSGQK